MRENDTLGTMILRLLDLYNTDSDDEEDTPPDFRAFLTALRFVSQTSNAMGGGFAHGTPVVSRGGGIIIYWMRDHRSIHLMMPPSGKHLWAHVVNSFGNLDSLVENDIAPETLAGWLRSLDGKE